MGYLRQGQPAALDRAALTDFIAAVVIDNLPDPFEIAHDCVNPSGHHPVASCGDVVCTHCTKVFWQ